VAQYLKVSSFTGGSSNSGLKRAITYIGKCYCRRAKKNYYEYGIKFIAKKFGRFRKNAIRRMVDPLKIKNSDAKQWCYHRQIYGKVYGQIIKLLDKSPPSDKEYVKELLHSLYQDICKNTELGSRLAHLCSDALIFWQKDMLDLQKIKSNISINDRVDVAKILKQIAEFDKPLP
jgi:hypothetical protein